MKTTSNFIKLLIVILLLPAMNSAFARNQGLYDDSTVRKGGWHLPVGNNKKSSSSSSSSSSLIPSIPSIPSSPSSSSSSSAMPDNWIPATSISSAWTDYSGSYSPWAPVAYQQISDFSQSRTRSAQQEMYTQDREYNTSTGLYRNVGSPIRQTQSVNDIESRVVVVTSSVTDVGPHSGCSSWTPDASTITLGQSFTQTRSCTTNFNRDYVFSIGGGWTDSFTGPVTESQIATGTLVSNVWVTATSTTTSWAKYADSYTSWTPAPYQQKSDFTQTRTHNEEQEQYTQAREYNSALTSYRNVGLPVRSTRTVFVNNESRLVTVIAGPLVNDGAATSYSAWSPDASTVTLNASFNQTRSYTQPQSITYTFSIGYSWKESYALIVTETRTNVGTATNGGGGCSSGCTYKALYSGNLPLPTVNGQSIADILAGANLSTTPSSMLGAACPTIGSSDPTAWYDSSVSGIYVAVCLPN
jgi:hypothetical protein